MGSIVFGLLGAGGFGREVMPFVRKSIASTLDKQESEIDVYFVETWEPTRSQVNGYPLISLDAFLKLNKPKYFNVAVGNGRDREAMVAAVGAGAEAISLFAQQTIVFDGNHMSIGSVFCPNTIVTSNVKIGKFFQCNIYSYVAHDCVIGDYVTFAPSVKCNGNVVVEDYAYIGTGAIIKQGKSEDPITIGEGAVVGMGAVVTKSVPPGVTVFGNPASLLTKRSLNK